MTPADVDAVAHVFVAVLADRLVIDGADGHHLQRVRRLEVDELVTAADGTGSWAEFTVAASADGRVELVARSEHARRRRSRRSRWCSRWRSRRAVSTRSSRVRPSSVSTRSCPCRPRARSCGGTRRVPSARSRVCRQSPAKPRCSRAARASRRSTRLRASKRSPRRRDLVVADRTGCRAERARRRRRIGSWCVLVGPEGGFAADERKRLADHPHLRLGDHVLRAATAPIVALVILGDRIAQMGHT